MVMMCCAVLGFQIGACLRHMVVGVVTLIQVTVMFVMMIVIVIVIVMVVVTRPDRCLLRPATAGSTQGAEG
jgi:hypothetical protein